MLNINKLSINSIKVLIALNDKESGSTRKEISGYWRIKDSAFFCVALIQLLELNYIYLSDSKLSYVSNLILKKEEIIFLTKYLDITTPNEIEILFNLKGNSLSQQELLRETGLGAPALSRSIRSLVDKNLVYKTDNKFYLVE